MLKKLLSLFVFLMTVVGSIHAQIGGTSAGFLTSTSTFQTLEEGKTIHYEFTQHTNGQYSWEGWILVVGNENVLDKTSWNLKDAALMMVLNSNTNEKTGNIQGCSNDFPYAWSEFAYKMQNAWTDMYVTLKNGELQMTSMMTDRDGSVYYNNFSQTTNEKSLKVGLSFNNAQLELWKEETLNDSYVLSKATLEHTASTWYNDNFNDIRYSHNAEKEHYRYYYDNNSASVREGFAFAQFSYSKLPEELIESANLLWSFTNGKTGGASAGSGISHDIYYLNSGVIPDYNAIDEQTAGVLKYRGSKAVATNGDSNNPFISTVNSNRNLDDAYVTSNVTNAVKDRISDGRIVFQWVLNRMAQGAGADLLGKGSSHFPVLKILKKVSEKAKTQAKLWDFTDWTSTQAEIEAIPSINDGNHYRKWENKGNEAQGTFKSVAWSSSGITEADGLWFGSKDASTVSFRVKVGTDGYIRPITPGGTISIPVQAGQIVTISAYTFEDDKASNYTFRSVTSSGDIVNEKTGNFRNATDVIYQAQSDGYVDFTWRGGTYPCIKKIRVDNAPGFLGADNTIVQTIPDQEGELIKLEFDEPDIVMPEGAWVTCESSNYKIAYCPSSQSQTLADGTVWGPEANYVGQVRFTGTGYVGITATVHYGDYTWPLEYHITVRADEGSMSSVGNEYHVYGHDVDYGKNIHTTGGKLADRVVKLRSLTAEFGPSDVFNTTIVRAIDGNPLGSHTVGVTTLATNGWRDAYFTDSSNPKKPTQGTFYKFVPKANGTLTVTGYISSSGVPAIMLDATNGYSQVGNPISWTNNSTLVTSTFTLQKDHEYYLFGVNPNYPNYNSYSNGASNSWATYQLVSINYVQDFKITTTEATTYLKDRNNSSIQTASTVVDRTATSYTANFTGASQNVTASVLPRGAMENKNVTVSVNNNGNGAGTITVRWDQVRSGEGGAIVVVANDGTDIFYTITVPYDKFTWDMHNHQSEVDKKLGSKELLDWCTTYEVRLYNEDTRALTYLNKSVLTSYSSMMKDNAAYIGQTAGLVVESSGSSFGLLYDAPNEVDQYVADHQTDGVITDTNGDGKITKDDLNEAKIDEILRSMLNHVYTSSDVQTVNDGAFNNGAYLTIPKLKAGQHVAIKWYRHAEKSGDKLHVSNAYGLKKWIDGETYDSSDPSELDVYLINQSGSSSVYNARYGWLEFIVAQDGDVTFTVADDGFTHIKQIAVSGVNEEIDNDLALRANAHTAQTRYTHEENEQVVQQFENGLQMHAQAYLDVEFRLRNIKGSFSEITMTSGYGSYTYKPGSSIKGRFNAPVAYTESYTETPSGGDKAKHGQGGLLTVVDGQGTFDVEQIIYSNGHAVEYQSTPLTIITVGHVDQEYPYTWDFTNISSSTMDNVTNTNSNWQSNGANSYTYNTTGQQNYLQGTELTNTGVASYNTSNPGSTLSEYDGLGFITSTNGAQSTGLSNISLTLPSTPPTTPEHGNAGGLVIGNTETTTLLVPNVPAGMTVYVRTTTPGSEGIVSISGDGESNSTKNASDDSGEKIYSFTTSANSDPTYKSDVLIDVKGVTVKGIAVSKFTKTCWFRDNETDVYYNTDSHACDIDYSLTEYYTGNAINAYYVATSVLNKDRLVSSLVLSPIAQAPSNTGYIVSTKYTSDPNKADVSDASYYMRPLFVPCENDKATMTANHVTTADYQYGFLYPHLEKKPIAQESGYDYYILTNLWYNTTHGSSSNMSQASVPGFYRVAADDATSLEKYRAYLRLPKSSSPTNTKFIPLFDYDFDGDFAVAIDEVPAEVTESVIDMNGTFYTLQGMKIEGFPKKSGIYMQNGKKILVK